MAGLRQVRASSRALWLAVCAGTLLAVSHNSVDAQPAPPIAVAPASITGRDFAGLRFPLAATPGPIAFAARKVNVWTTSTPSDPNPVQRLFLSGDASVHIGVYNFEAANAIVWLQKIENSSTPNSPGVYQIFVYFDRLGDPTADAQDFAGVSVTADRLPVRAAIDADGPIGLKADLVQRDPPTDKTSAALVGDGEAALAKSLRTLAGIKEPTAADESELPIAARGIRAPVPIIPAEPEPPRLAKAQPRDQPQDQPDGRPAQPSPAVADRGSPRRPAQPSQTPTQPAARPGEAPPTIAKAPPQPAQPSEQPGAPTPSPPEQARANEPAPLPGTTRPFRPSAEPSPAAEVNELLKTLPPAQPSKPIFIKQGLIAVDTPTLTHVSGIDENAVIAQDGVSIQYTNAKTLDTLQMTAQRAVIFLAPGPTTQLARFSPDQVRGIYLEGDVVASSITKTGDALRQRQYTLRGPQMFYDVQKNKAVILDAVFWTYDAPRRLPLFLRADVIRQQSESQFTAEHARLANTSFFDPELALGASTLTITRIPAPPPTGGGEGGPGVGPGEPGFASTTGGAGPRSSLYVEASNITLRSSDFPFFYFPYYAGDPTGIPLKDLRVENSSESGDAIKTTWNAVTLLGLDKYKEFDADALVDYYFERGLALGSILEWGKPGGGGPYKGGLFGYLVLDDKGTDLLKPGTKIEHDGGARGMILAENRWKLDEHWTLFTDAAYIGDQTFIDGFFEEMGENHREFTNRAYARRLEDNTALTIEAKGEFNDFIANEYLLQTPGYQTDKLPEIAYFRQSDDLLGGVAPGLLSYFSEYRAGRLSLNFDQPTAAQHGFTTNLLAERALGIASNESVADRLRAQGYQEDGVFRVDTRQELSSQLSAGPINFTPFVVGRLTGYDNDFQSFSPNEDDNVRLWGAVGARAATTIQRVDDSVDSRLLDLHRIRHILEPGITVMESGTNVDRVNLPVYDENIEDITEGGMIRLGLNQTWQTKRGGPGRWSDIDAFKWDNEVVFSSGDMDDKTPIGRFFDFRPEYSVPGNYYSTQGLWQVSSAVALAGGDVYDFDLQQQARSNIGIVIEHSPAFRVWTDMRYVNSQDTTFVNMGVAYEVEKYTGQVSTSYDATEGGFQTFNFEILRRSASCELGLSISYNDITGETGFGFVLRPLGVRGGGARVNGLGGSNSKSRTTGVGGDQ